MIDFQEQDRCPICGDPIVYMGESEHNRLVVCAYCGDVTSVFYDGIAIDWNDLDHSDEEDSEL